MGPELQHRAQGRKPGHTWENRRQSEARSSNSCRRDLGLAWGRPHSSLAPSFSLPTTPLPFSMARVAFFTNLVPASHPGVGPHRLSLPAWCPRPTVPLTLRPAPLPRMFPFLDYPLSPLPYVFSPLPAPLWPCASCSPRVAQQRWPYLHLGMAWQLLGRLQGQRHLRRGQMGFATRYSLRSHEPPLRVLGSGRSRTGC